MGVATQCGDLISQLIKTIKKNIYKMLNEKI